MYLTTLTCYLLCCVLEGFNFHNSIAIIGLIKNLVTAQLIIHIVPKPTYTRVWSISCYAGAIFLGLASQSASPRDPAAIVVMTMCALLMIPLLKRTTCSTWMIIVLTYVGLVSAVVLGGTYVHFHMVHGCFGLVTSFFFTSDRNVDVPIHGLLTGMYIETLAWSGTEDFLLYSVSFTPLRISTLVVVWVTSLSFVVCYEWLTRRTQVDVETIPVKVETPTHG